MIRKQGSSTDNSMPGLCTDCSWMGSFGKKKETLHVDCRIREQIEHFRRET